MKKDSDLWRNFYRDWNWCAGG